MFAGKQHKVIVEFARGHIRAAIDGKTVTIDGELLVATPGLPDYVIYKDSIERWDPPNDGEVIDQATRDRIVEMVRAEMLKEGLTIDVE
jgi:hypothetical protein